METRYWSPKFLGSLSVQAGPAMQYPAKKERLRAPRKSRTVDGRNPQDHDQNVGLGVFMNERIYEVLSTLPTNCCPGVVGRSRQFQRQCNCPGEVGVIYNIDDSRQYSMHKNATIFDAFYDQNSISPSGSSISLRRVKTLSSTSFPYTS